MAKRNQPRRKTAAKPPAAKRKAATGKTAARRTAARKGTVRRSAAQKRARRPNGAKLMGRLAVEQTVPVDAVRLLEQDHREVESLFSQFRQTEDAGEKEALALKICLLLKVHTQIEEEILYPAAREALDEEDMIDEAEVEHGSARSLMAQIEKMEVGEDLYDAKVNVLGEYIRHHVQEEETEFFPVLRGAGLDMMELGGELAARRIELLAKLTGKG